MDANVSSNGPTQVKRQKLENGSGVSID